MDWLRPPTITTTLKNIINTLDKYISIFEYDFDKLDDVHQMELLRDYYQQLLNENNGWKQS